MKRFKLRAECLADVVRLIHAQGFTNGLIETHKGFPDVEFEFESNDSMSTLLSRLQRIEDGHVMLETLQPVELYDGNRTRRRA